MAEFEEKPDTQFFDDALAYLQDKWSDTHTNWKLRDSFYRRDYEVWQKPEDRTNRSSYRSSVPTSIIDHAADTQLSFNPKVHRPAPRPNSRTESVVWSDEIETAMKGILDDASERETELPFKAMGKFLLHLGYGILEMGWDKDDRQGPDGASYNPVRLSAPHPSTILLDPDEKTPTLGIKHMEMRASRLQAWTESLASGEKFERPDVKVFKPDRNPFEMVKLNYLWTPFWTMLRLVEGDVLFTMENTWGETPWSHAFAGYGMEMTDENKRDPLNHAQGLLSPILGTIQAKAQSDSAKHQNQMDRSYPRFGSIHDPETVAQMLERGMLEGEKLDFWVMETVALDRSVFEVGREYDQEMVNATYSRSLTGERQEGVDTVGQQAILSNAASRKFNTPAIQMAAMASQQVSKVLRLIDLNDDPVGINNKKINRTMIEKDFTASVTFETSDPVLGIQKREIGMREVVQGLKSWERYQTEDSELEDLSAERAAQDRDLVDNHPAVIHQRAKRAALEMGEDLDAAIAEMEADEAAAAGASTRPRGGTEGARGPQSNTPTEGAVIREGLTGDTQQPARNGSGITGA